MIAVLQRVKKASVDVDGRTVGRCGAGLCVLLGVAAGDTEEDADALVQKIVALRIFTDGQGKMNLSLQDIGGGVLVISNFTLLAAYRKGKRPDFTAAAPAGEAERLYRYFADRCRDMTGQVECGVFGAHMELSLTDDGPVTIVMDSKVLLKRTGEAHT